MDQRQLGAMGWLTAAGDQAIDSVYQRPSLPEIEDDAPREQGQASSMRIPGQNGFAGRIEKVCLLARQELRSRGGRSFD